MDGRQEKQAIKRLKMGDIDALKPLVEAYQTRALRTAYLITQDQKLAEDVTQTAFVRVFDSIHQFNSSRHFLPWFLRIVSNLALQSVQKQARTLPLDDDREDGLSLADLLPDAVLSPETQVEILELEAQIQALLQELSPEQRLVIVLRYYVDFSEEEMSKVLDVPQGTVKSRLFNARKQLRRLFSVT
jgi:RNA polymerase sigma-70 factor (ECF subfamily)